VVVGERTWGKGSVQNVIELEGGKSALKLTTASYHRPNGKNIHRFPDAKETDEWGVLPDDGYAVKLNPGQTEQMIRDRRDRDVLVGKHAKALAAGKDAAPVDADKDAPPKTEPADAAAAKPKAAAPFVDPQLQKAVDYLNQELARAQ
jgi:carboxyl-terminal processing protease